MKEHCFFKFLEASALSQDYPLVVWIDNCQWMEKTSFQWVMSAVHYFAKTSAKHMLFVLTCTTSKPEESRFFLDKDLQDLKSKSDVQLMEISLGNLDRQTLAIWLEYMFGSNSGSLNHVTSHIYPITKGNPLYTKELLFYLLENSLIQNNLTTTKSGGKNVPNVLRHDADEISNFETTHFSKKIQKLSKESMEVIQIAACMGYCVNSKLLSSVLPYNTLQHLEVATKVGILNCDQCNNSKSDTDSEERSFQFIHNSMHQSVIKSIGFSNVNDVQRMHMKIARRLIQNLSDIDLKTVLLTVVGHAIQGSTCIQVQERQLFATLALDAAQLAVKKMSLEAAQQSIKFAIGILDESCWETKYDLALALYNAAAEIEYTVGDFSQVEQITSEVLTCAQSFDDKLQAYSTRLYMLGSTNWPSEAITLGLTLLENLGQQFPSNPMPRHVMVALIRTRLCLRGKSTEMLLRLPTITNDRAAASLQIMNILFSSAIFQCPTLLPLLAMRMIQVSLKFGLSVVSCIAFALYGTLLVSKSRAVCDGVEMGDLSLRLLHCFQCRSWIPRVNAIVFGFIHGWQRPIHKAFKHLVCGYQIALETGDIEFAMVNVFVYLNYLFNSGVSLKQVKEEYKTYVEELPRMHSNATIILQTNLFMTIHNLMYGQSEAGTPDLQNGIGGGGAIFHSAQLILLAVVYGNYQQAVDVGQSLFQQYPLETIDFASYYLLIGVASIAMYQQKGCKNSRLLLTARYFKKQIVRLCNSSLDYCISKLTLLEAEISSISKRHHCKTLQKFNAAIALAEGKKNYFEVAFARERFARYLLSQGDYSSALSCFQLSCIQYQEWNAFQKVELLQSEIDVLVNVHDFEA